jgi:hypothetical protein
MLPGSAPLQGGSREHPVTCSCFGAQQTPFSRGLWLLCVTPHAKGHPCQCTEKGKQTREAWASVKQPCVDAPRQTCRRTCAGQVLHSEDRVATKHSTAHSMTKQHSGTRPIKFILGKCETTMPGCPCSRNRRINGCTGYRRKYIQSKTGIEGVRCIE